MHGGGEGALTEGGGKEKVSLLGLRGVRELLRFALGTTLLKGGYSAVCCSSVFVFSKITVGGWRTS